jgi:hypothetical protein
MGRQGSQFGRNGVSVVQINGGLLRWPHSILGPRPGLKELSVFCWALFVFGFIFPLSVVLWVRSKSGVKFSSLLPIDFIYFYGIGHILNQHPAVQLYDYGLQLKTFNDIYLLKENQGVWGRSPYPPFVAKFFSMYARFSFEQAYFLWMGTSFALYIAGIATAVKAALPNDRLRGSLVFCFSLSSPLFLRYNLIGGQLAPIAVFSTGLAIFLERRSLPLLSGLALSILTYKPTLLLLIVPMLLITRRLRTFFGFALGATVLMATSTAVGGLQIWPAYARFLESFAGNAGIHGESAITIKRWEYVDIFNSLWYGIPGGRSWIGLTILAFVLLGLGTWFGRLLYKSRKAGISAQNLAWATTLAWTLIINVYVPVYDTLLIAVVVTLTIGALLEVEGRIATRWFVLLTVGISAVSMKAESIAQNHRIQPLTILILIFGLMQIIVLKSVVNNKLAGAEIAFPGDLNVTS